MRDCVDIVIVDDNDVEGDHQFELMITDTTPETILLDSSITTIMITDDPGKSEFKYGV